MPIDFDSFGNNSNAARMLDTYLESTQTEYAVLVSGPWGCGKTHFIKKFLKAKKEQKVEVKNEQESNDKISYCYVSLFDVKTYDDIDKSIIAQANPFLNSDKAKYLGRFTNYFLDKMITTSLPADIADTTKEVKDKATSFFTSFLEKFPEKLVIVLDDLERTSLTPLEILGYTNNLTVSNCAKVILLADEKLLSQPQTSCGDIRNFNFDFKTFKEKVIGKTLEIENDFDSVYSDFCSNITNKKIQHLLIENKNHFLFIYTHFEYKNLRQLKYILGESSIFLNVFLSKKLDNYDLEFFYKDFFSLLTYLTYEIHTQQKDIDTIIRETVSRFSNNALRANGKFISSKLSYYSDSDTWIAYFQGKFVYNELLSALLEYYEDKYKELNIDIGNITKFQFINLYNTLNQGIAVKKYLTPQKIYQAFSQKLYFAEQKLITLKESELKEEFSKYINDVSIEVEKETYYDRFDSNKFYSRFSSIKFSDTDAYFKGEIIKKVNNIRLLEYQKTGRTFINLLSNYEKLYDFIHNKIYSMANFNLSYIDPKEFIEKISTVSHKKAIIFELEHLSTTHYIHENNNCTTCNWWKTVYEEFQQLQLSPYDKIILSRILKSINFIEHTNPWKEQNRLIEYKKT